jgi:MraZ protein
VFRGAARLKLDTKSRIAVPSRHREALQELCGGQLVVTVDPMTQDPCLMLYPLPVWEAIERRLTTTPALKRQVRNLKRILMGYATDVELDAQGRVRIPQTLRDFAGLETDIMLVGQGNKFEVWDAARWQDCCAQLVTEDISEADLPPELASLVL